jgi:hypothetical protein
MATPIPADVDNARRRVREMIGETDTTSAWESRDIDLLLAGATSLEAAAADGWEKKAARYAELTDVSESGSSRKNSQLHPMALKMWEKYTELAEEGDAGAAPAGTGTRVRPIVRE